MTTGYIFTVNSSKLFYDVSSITSFFLYDRMATEEDLEAFQKEGHVAFVVGYTGETGKELVKALSLTKPFARVVLIGRRKTNVTENLGPEFVSQEGI